MHLSFFIKPTTEVLRDIKRLLTDYGFDVCSYEISRPDRIVIFNGRESNNFSYTAHKLLAEAPEEAGESPFLVRAGNDWTIHGLTQILENYAHFRFIHFGKFHFPEKGDAEKKAIEDKDLLIRVEGIEHGMQDCELSSEEELRRFSQIKKNLNKKSVDQVKREILYFLIRQGRVKLPWGNPPTSRRSLDLLIEWLRKVNRYYPTQRSTLEQFKEDMKKVYEVKSATSLQLT